MTGNYRKYPYQLLVAKYSLYDGWLPYYAHLMDTAGVMGKLLNHWLPVHIIEEMSERETFVEWDKLCTFIALVHDIGKATSVFQSKICERAPYLREKIENAGIMLHDISEFTDSSKTPHAYASEAILLNAGCPDGIAAVAGSHHGKPFSGIEDPEELMFNYEENFYGKQGERHKWRTICSQWIEIALNLSGYHDIAELPEIGVPTQMILSGLLMMADWIASNTQYAPLIALDDEGTDIDYPVRIEQIWALVSFPDQWMPSIWFMDDVLFKERYGFVPNDIQCEILKAVEEASAPGIYVLEAQMGSGKTEAALSAAEVLASKWHCEGVFFGLPTQATANGIFPRMKTWVEGQSDGIQLSIKLAHGSAALQKDYRELFHGSARQNEDENGGLIVHNWFEGRKQALLSSFVIGTVDQMLMSALQQKHVMLRHLGLAGKIVIIDECHAYDAYMNCYLERALEWLGTYGVPVILLSATLPSKRRARLIEAYIGKKIKAEPDNWRENISYPLLSYTDGNAVKQCVIPINEFEKKIKVIRTSDDGIVGTLAEKLAGGGCAGVIANTVALAQSVARTIKEAMPDYTVILVHARFTMADRQQTEEEILRRLGKSSSMQERRLIVVGTQILEQSLDIDFDLLITQLAPMDLLLQRIGRLHRHSQRERPTALKEPVCIVFEDDEASGKIYGDWLLRRTDELLPEKICIPKDISPLVQETYRDMKEEEVLYPLWVSQMEQQIVRERKAASHRILSQNELEDTMHGLLDHPVGDWESDALARVRDGEDSISVLLMVCADEGYVQFLPWQDKGEKIAMDHVPSEEEARKILLQKVQLPRAFSSYKYNECVGELEGFNLDFLAEWQKSYWLQGELVLMLDGNLCASLCGYSLRYDKEYGLAYEKEG